LAFLYLADRWFAPRTGGALRVVSTSQRRRIGSTGIAALRRSAGSRYGPASLSIGGRREHHRRFVFSDRAFFSRAACGPRVMPSSSACASRCGKAGACDRFVPGA